MKSIQAVYLSLLTGWTLSEILILLLTRTRLSTGTVRDRGSLRILWPVIVISISLGTAYGDSHARNIFHDAHWVQVAALMLFIAGLILRWTAILSLGRSFSANVAIHTTQKLYTRGLFSIVRHPSYTGMLLIFAALGVFTRNWIGLAITVLPGMAALLYRIHVEEAALLDGFGEQYRAYSATTKRLFPGIY